MAGTDMEKLREPLSDLAACGLPCALEAMGERWSFMILRAAFNGVRHFEEFLDQLGIARNILSNRLSRLVESGILKREPCADDRRRIEYRLTPKGFDLLPAMLALRQWGEKWALGVPANPVLCDARDGQPILPITIRAHDDRVLGPADLTWRERADIEAEGRSPVRAVK
ncbi:winged helix-turn-helix transcriptional regulator [Novosphingobium cyanobacteriorum]|uniref:Helix-turn-helix domain-containing protein n=1 Tax=Novosphingobium cyanobacteriorum TaxID=3024215 RepID=A0ABT6CGY6_9SPHN|nr:helix-turn-helix domain-containing protein [Novosphingobium cyanobacteriorum]MDF8333186.1 helix-turn-helix domain-containing protein [Novosphingobium cyanobacteriorum]